MGTRWLAASHDGPRRGGSASCGRAVLAAASALLAAASACGSASSPTPTPSAANVKAASHLVLAKGQVTAISNTSITVVTKSGSSETFQLGTAVKVKQGGSKASLDAAGPGASVVLYAAAGTSGTDRVVDRIVIKAPAPSPSPSAAALETSTAAPVA